MSVTFHFRRLIFFSISIRSLASASSSSSDHLLVETISQSQPRYPKTRTPLKKQFETWIKTLKPGFTCSDLSHALRAQSDPDIALDIFRWTAHQRNYKHDSSTYLTMIEIASGKMICHAKNRLNQIHVHCMDVADSIAQVEGNEEKE